MTMGQRDPAIALHGRRTAPARLDIQRISRPRQADQCAAQRRVPITQSLHARATGISRFWTLADGPQGQTATRAKQPKPDDEHEQIAEIDQQILAEEDRSDDGQVGQYRDGVARDLRTGDARVVRAQKARQVRRQQSQHEADRHLVAPQLDAGKADQQGDQRADQHSHGDAQQELPRHIQHARLLRSPSRRKAQHRRQRQTAIQRQVDYAGALGHRLAQTGDHQWSRRADDAAQGVEELGIHAPTPKSPPPERGRWLFSSLTSSLVSSSPSLLCEGKGSGDGGASSGKKTSRTP